MCVCERALASVSVCLCIYVSVCVFLGGCLCVCADFLAENLMAKKLLMVCAYNHHFHYHYLCDFVCALVFCERVLLYI
jgi:hypothetical protein